MTYTLENPQCRVAISQLGAELCSFVRTDLADGPLEYIWSADPAYWGPRQEW